MFQTKVVKKIKKHILRSILFSEGRAFYEIMWKNNVEPDRPRMKIWRMRIACWINKASKTHSEYVILVAFPQQQWLNESAWMLCCRYSTACIVYQATVTSVYWYTEVATATTVRRLGLVLLKFIYYLNGGIKFNTTRKILISSSVFKRKFQLPSNNSVCAGTFHLLRGRVVWREHWFFLVNETNLGNKFQPTNFSSFTFLIKPSVIPLATWRHCSRQIDSSSVYVNHILIFC